MLTSLPSYQVNERYIEIVDGETIHRLAPNYRTLKDKIVAYELYVNGSTATVICQRIHDGKLFRIWLLSATSPAIAVEEKKSNDNMAG